MSQDSSAKTTPIGPYLSKFWVMADDRKRLTYRLRPNSPIVVATAPGTSRRYGVRPPRNRCWVHQVQAKTTGELTTPTRPFRARPAAMLPDEAIEATTTKKLTSQIAGRQPS